MYTLNKTANNRAPKSRIDHMTLNSQLTPSLQSLASYAAILVPVHRPQTLRETLLELLQFGGAGYTPHNAENVNEAQLQPVRGGIREYERREGTLYR